MNSTKKFAMKKLLNLLFGVACLAIFGCGDVQTEHKFTCGSQLSKAELAEFEVVTKPGYKPIELKLLGKLSLAIFDATGRHKNYNVQFFENTRERLVVQVYGIWELTEMDKAACAVFNFTDYMLPPNTMVIFYQNEKNAPKQHIVTGLRMSK